MNAQSVPVPVFACADCDPRERREVLTLGFSRPHKCDACGETKESTEFVYSDDLDAQVSERARSGRLARFGDRS